MAIPNVYWSQCRNLIDQVSAAGGAIPKTLTALASTIDTVGQWTPPPATDIAALISRGALTSDNAAETLDAALTQPNRTPNDIKHVATSALSARFASLVVSEAGADIVESLRKPFTTAAGKIAKAAQDLPSHATAADAIDANLVNEWRIIAEQREHLEQMFSLVDTLISTFDILGPRQPWAEGIDLRAFFLATDPSHLHPITAALRPSGNPRGGRWHTIASAITLNTVERARELLADTEAEYRDAEAARYALTHS